MFSGHMLGMADVTFSGFMQLPGSGILSAGFGGTFITENPRDKVRVGPRELCDRLEQDKHRDRECIGACNVPCMVAVVAVASMAENHQCDVLASQGKHWKHWLATLSQCSLGLLIANHSASMHRASL